MTIQFASFSLHGAAALSSPAEDQHGFRRIVRRTFTVSGAGQRNAQSAPLALLGPADVLGVDPQQIVRRTPPPGHQQAEPNYLASIEFAHPDLPWLFTASADRTAPLPWLMLLVVDDTGPDTVTAAIGGRNPTVTVGPDQLPDPADAAAWAHIQISTDKPAKALLEAPQPDWSLVRSRLLSPRRLAPDHGYVACLVPVFEAGRLAGLGIPPSPDAIGPDPWDHTAQVTLPVYDHWRFGTGDTGDFESLASRLRPSDEEGHGVRSVAVDPFAARLQQPGTPALFPPAVRLVPTAMAADDGPGPLAPGPTSDPHAPDLWARLKFLIDITAAAADDPHPIVGAPLYGQWHAAVTSLDGRPEQPALVVPPTPGKQAWIAELNADPYGRLAAGLGTRLVRRDQEALMADAWAQLDAVAEANNRIRWAQLASTIAEPLHSQLGEMPDAAVLRVLNPMLDDSPPPEVQPVDVAELPVAISDLLSVSDASLELLTPAFLRASRFAAQAIGGADQPPAALVAQTTFEEVGAAAADFIPSGFAPPAVDLDSLARAVTEAGNPDLAVGTSTAGEVLTALHTVDAVVADTLAAVVAAAHPPAPGEQPKAILAERLAMIAEVQRATFATVQLAAPDTTSLLIAMSPPSAPPDAVAAAVAGGPEALLEPGPAPVPVPAPEPVADLAHDAAAPDPVGADQPLARAVIDAIAPAPRYTAMLAADQVLDAQAAGRPWQRSALHPISATPVFDTPMVERLRLLDQEWVLGGVGTLEVDRVYVMTANRRFVEALLVGANHEMLRELRWRGYPADPRGSSFRRFWPTTGANNEPTPDVSALDEWAGHLGDNEPGGASGNTFTIVVIKAELLRRYPSTIITVELGAVDGAGSFVTVRAAKEMFRGRLDPDVSYFAFEIDPHDDLHSDAGTDRWFLSLRQPIDEPRFGLDEFVPDPGAPPEKQAAPPNDTVDPDHWTWQGLSRPDPPFLVGSLVDADVDAHGHAGTSAQVGANLFQRPFRALLAARDFVPRKP